MKMINKKVLTTTIAATVLLGGGAFSLLQSDALADEPASTAAPAPTPAKPDGSAKKEKAPQDRHVMNYQFKFNLNEGSMLKDAAALLGLEEKALVEKLKSGQTLLEIATAAGVSETDLLNKLTEASSKKLDEAVSAGKLTQEQADKMKADLTAKLKEGIASKNFAFGRGAGPAPGLGGPGRGQPGLPGKPGFGPGGQMGFGVFGNADQLAQILGMTKEELKAAQDAGKSLSEIAQEKGMSEDDLIAKLKEALSDGLKKFVESKPQARPEGKPELKERMQELQGKAQELKQKLHTRERGQGDRQQPAPQQTPQQQKWKPSASTSVSNT